MVSNFKLNDDTNIGIQWFFSLQTLFRDVGKNGWICICVRKVVVVVVVFVI